jgi:hypothetical protein
LEKKRAASNTYTLLLQQKLSLEWEEKLQKKWKRNNEYPSMHARVLIELDHQASTSSVKAKVR